MSVDVIGVPITRVGEPDADHDLLNGDPPVATSTSGATSRTRPFTKPGECCTWWGLHVDVRQQLTITGRCLQAERATAQASALSCSATFGAGPHGARSRVRPSAAGR